MPNPIGVEILLAHGARVPWWIRLLDYVHDVRREFGGKKIRCIQIRGVKDAAFVPSGGVGIRHLPGFKPLAGICIFGPMQVLEIRNLATGETIERNPYCCPKCLAMTGQKEYKLKKKSAVAGREWWVFGCFDCREPWEVLV